MKQFRSNVLICAGTGCVASGSLKVRDILEEEIKKHNLQDEVKIVLTGCNGFCAKGPLMVVYPEGIFYQALKPETIALLVEEHFLKGRPVKDLMYIPPAGKEPVPVMRDIPFFSHYLQVFKSIVKIFAARAFSISKSSWTYYLVKIADSQSLKRIAGFIHVNPEASGANGSIVNYDVQPAIFY